MLGEPAGPEPTFGVPEAVIAAAGPVSGVGVAGCCRARGLLRAACFGGRRLLGGLVGASTLMAGSVEDSAMLDGDGNSICAKALCGNTELNSKAAASPRNQHRI